MQEPPEPPTTGLDIRWSGCPAEHGPAREVLSVIEQMSGPGAVVVACGACVTRQTGAW